MDEAHGRTLDSPRVVPSPVDVPKIRRAAIATALLTAPFALAYRFALIYRYRAGHPRPHLPLVTPASLGLPYEPVAVPTEVPWPFFNSTFVAAGVCA